MNAQTYLIAAFIVAVGYVWFLNRLNKAVQTSRLELADIGEPMLHDSAIPIEVRTQVKFYLDRAFSWWPTVVAALIFPFAFVLILLGYQGPVERNLLRASPKDRAAYRRTVELFSISQIAANPVFAAIVAIELLLCLILAVFVGRPVATVLKALESAFLIDVAISRAATA